MFLAVKIVQKEFIFVDLEVIMVKAVYPGSFDPVTNGHIDVITRAAAIVDEVIIGVLVNKKKSPFFTMEERFEMLKKAVADIPNVSVKTFEGTTVDFAKEL